MSSGHEESFLTVAEVAELLKLNQQTVRNWIDQGSMPSVRVGRRVRVKKSDLDRIIEEGYRGGTGDAPRSDGPSAADFWGGEPVGEAEPDPDVTGAGASQPDTGSPAPRAGDQEPPAGEAPQSSSEEAE
jgi:excisionase family DNA binding protein